jgi:hypothetical protein
VQTLQHWLESRDLAGVRGPQALAILPEAEPRLWQTLWDDVAGTLARAQRKATPEKSSTARSFLSLPHQSAIPKKFLKKFGALSSRTGHWKQTAIEAPVAFGS